MKTVYRSCARAASQASVWFSERPASICELCELVCRSMEKPACLFDGRNLLDHAALFELGFNVYAIGQAPRTH